MSSTPSTNSPPLEGGGTSESSDATSTKPWEPQRKRKEEEGCNDDVAAVTHPRTKKAKSLGASLSNENPPEKEEDEGAPTKLLTRREANRIHAFKSRQRSKNLLQELQQLVTQYNYEKLELERQNAVLSAQVEVLQQQNLTLLQSHAPPLALAPNSTPPLLQALLQALSTPTAAAPWNAPAAPVSSWMNLLFPPTGAATAATTASEPHQQLQRAFQQAQAEAASVPKSEEPALHPV